MKLHKLIQRASAAAVASAMILSVTLPTLAAAPDEFDERYCRFERGR